MTEPDGWTFCAESELGYVRSRTVFAPGKALTFDDNYRLAHLPLVAPSHPLVVSSRSGVDYTMGRHSKRVFSLVLPVAADLIENSDSFRQLDAEFKGVGFSGKIAWKIAQARRDKLHVTICNEITAGDPPMLGDSQRREIAKLGPIAIEVRGPFSGTVNHGRIYLRVYPERRNGRNVFQEIQRILNRPVTDVFVLGLHNLIDTLTVDETAAFAALIDRWWERLVLRAAIDRLEMIGTMDSLVLDSFVSDRIALGAGVRAFPF
jgi:hypothetical protein